MTKRFYGFNSQVVLGPGHTKDVNNSGGLCLHGTHSIGIKGLVIDYGEGAGGGGYKMEKMAGPKLFGPPSQDRVKLFAHPF